MCARKNGEACFIGGGSCELVRMEEFLPFAFASLLKRRWRWELGDKGPGAGPCPVVKCLQRGGIVFMERIDQLIDKRGALLDETALIATKVTQFEREGILSFKRVPVHAVTAKSAGHRVAIKVVVFVATGSHAIAVTFGCGRLDWVNVAT